MQNTVVRSVIFTILLFCCALPCHAQSDQSNWYFTGSAGVYSSYLWAGNMFGGVCFVPYAETGYIFNDDLTFFSDAFTSSDFNAGLYLPGSEKYNCKFAGFDIGLNWRNLSIYIDDIIEEIQLTDINFHYFGLCLDWTLSDDYPLTVNWYSLLYNSNTEGEEWIDGKQAHSTLINISYPYKVNEKFSIGPEIAAVPWNSPYCGYDKFSICQIGIDGAYTVPLTQRLSIPLSLKAGWNPAQNTIYYEASVLLRFE